MPKSFLPVLLFAALGSAPSSFAQQTSSYIQRCRFLLDGVERKTEQRDFGDLFSLERVEAQYLEKDADPATRDDHADIAVTVLNERNGPSVFEEDGERTTERWAHEERLVIRHVSSRAKARLGFALPIGTPLDLICENSESKAN